MVSYFVYQTNHAFVISFKPDVVSFTVLGELFLSYIFDFNMTFSFCHKLNNWEFLKPGYVQINK
jgi:hypothetical protein